MEPEVVKSYRVYYIYNAGKTGICMPTKAMAEEVLSLLQSNKDGVITFPGHTCKLFNVIPYAEAEVDYQLVEAEYYGGNEMSIADALEDYGIVEPTEFIEFSIVKDVGGGTFYLNEEQFFYVDNASMTSGPGVASYKLDMNDLVEQMKCCLTKFGYKIVKE